MARTDPPIHKLLKRQSVAFLLAAFFACSFLIIIGILIDSSHTSLSKLLIILGGSGLGACVGLVFGGITDSSGLQRVRELVEVSLSSSLSAPDQELEAFRKIWHHYLLTKINNKVVWRYRKLDLSRTSVPGKLVTAFNVPGPGGESHTYNIEGYLAEPRLVFIQTPAGGTEPPIVHIYPRATDRFRSLHAGIAMLQSWDGDNLMVPVLMCATRLDLELGDYSEGTLPNQAFSKLNEMWQREANSVGLVLIDKAEELGSEDGGKSGDI